jgi:aspartate/tyrosine/aromatic aminotransferase
MEDLLLHLQSRMVIALHTTVQPHNLNAFDWSRGIWVRAGMSKAELARMQREADAAKAKQTEQAGALERQIDTAGTFGL